MRTNILLLGLLVLGFFSYAYGDSGYSTNAYYAVMFDDRGLASTALRLDYVNSGASPVDHVNLDISGTDVRIVSAYVREECEPANRPRDYSYGHYDSDCPYPGYSFVPAKVTPLGSGGYSIALNRTIEAGKGTSVLVFYRAFGYVEDTLIGKRFDFETPSFDFDVESTRVAIDVDEDLHLKEGGSEGNYNQMRNAVLLSNAAPGSGGLQSALSSSYSYVSHAYGYVREKSVLLAGESFTMSGNYGKEWLLLYLPEVSAAVLLLIGAGWFVQKKAKEEKAERAKERASAEGRKGAAVEEARAKAVNPAGGGLAESAVFAFMCAVGFSLALSLVVLGIAWSKTKIELPLLSLIGLASWIASAALIYIRKSADGQGLACAMMFVGFSVIVFPFMALMAVWIAAMLTYRPYYGPYAL